MLKWRAIAGAILMLLVGCAVNVGIQNAQVVKSDKDLYNVSVYVGSESADLIKQREIYFSIVIVECSSSMEGYPIEPWVQGVRASEFTYAVDRSPVRFSGAVPAKVFEALKSPCVFLRGGNYLVDRMRTKEIRLILNDGSYENAPPRNEG